MAETEFGRLFEESVTKKIHPGALLSGEVVDICKDYVVVNAGLKSESYIPIKQFFNEQGDLDPIKIGDPIEVVVEAVENGMGETRLSREKAKKIKAWDDLVIIHKENKLIKGLVNSRVRGGFTVDLGLVKAFLPGSLVDVKPVRENLDLEGQELEFKIIKIDQKRNNIVVSRRSVLEQDNSQERKILIESLQEGQVVTGTVKNLVDYGAFIDLGGLDGLLHITDMAWKRVKHPSEIVSVGQEIVVKVLKFDKEKTRVSLGLKQLQEDPWNNVIQKYPVGSKLIGKVTNIADYGCFVEIDKGVEGLVYVSEIDWTNKNIHPSKVVQLGDEIEVMVIEIDEERRRISLGIKQCSDNPWSAFAREYNKGDQIKGKIKSITDFGIFIGLESGIDALIHLSDLSWDESPEQVIRNYKKGQEIEAVVLSIDVERERISLGIKQLEQDAFMQYCEQYSKGSIVPVVIKEITSAEVLVDLEEGVEGAIKSSELGKVGSSLGVGDQTEAKIINIDRKNRIINLSIKSKDEPSPKENNDNYSNEDTGAKLGDFLKEHINITKK